jgi:release factor glutamine methyltransferase
MAWTILKLLNWTTDFFKRHSVPSPRLDAEVLLSDLLGYTRVELYTHYDQPLGQDELAEYRARVSRRAAREPVAYIIGRKEFWGLDFLVGPGCLIPRPDTERLVEEAISILGGKKKAPRTPRTLPWSTNLAREAGDSGPGAAMEDEHDLSQAESRNIEAEQQTRALNSEESATFPSGKLVLDLCTGSGNIPICLAKDTGAAVIGVDLSPQAAEFARLNVAKHLLADRVAILNGDLARPVPSRFYGRFDLLTSNPPYLVSSTFHDLEPEIVRHEPRMALIAGDDGLAVCLRIIEDVHKLVKRGGWILIEIGTKEQAESLAGAMTGEGLTDVEILNDLAGLPRVVKARHT